MLQIKETKYSFNCKRQLPGALLLSIAVKALRRASCATSQRLNDLTTIHQRRYFCTNQLNGFHQFCMRQTRIIHLKSKS